MQQGQQIKHNLNNVYESKSQQYHLPFHIQCKRLKRNNSRLHCSFVDDILNRKLPQEAETDSIKGFTFLILRGLTLSALTLANISNQTLSTLGLVLQSGNFPLRVALLLKTYLSKSKGNQIVADALIFALRSKTRF